MLCFSEKNETYNNTSIKIVLLFISITITKYDFLIEFINIYNRLILTKYNKEDLCNIFSNNINLFSLFG